jgi:hypothetical protein
MQHEESIENTAQSMSEIEDGGHWPEQDKK